MNFQIKLSTKNERNHGQIKTIKYQITKRCSKYLNNM